MAATADAAGRDELFIDDGVAPEVRSRGLLIRRIPAGRLGLRARVTIAFALGAAILSAILAGTTFALTRSNLLAQRESAALTQAYNNARFVGNRLPIDTAQVDEVLGSLQTPTGSNPILFLDDGWFPLYVQFGEAALPASLRESVLTDGAAVRMRYDLDGTPQLAVGIPLAGNDGAYFEIVDLSEAETTLRSLVISLLGASVVTTAAGAALGWWASRRALRPLADVSQAAEAIAGGRLDTRLEATDDPDLGPLAASFNDMAQALQERIERDARFASDVSHELRSPLMTMSAAADVLANQRSELPERAQQAVDLVGLEIGRFGQLVEDLLEMSRYDAGAVRLERDDIRLAEFVLQAVGASGYSGVPIELDAELAGVVVNADKRRLARVIANLLDNAAKYGDGATVVSLRGIDDAVQIAVEDEGVGVPVDERELIFDRFARGGVAGRRGASEGVGLGLALVAEHVRLHGGRVWVEDRLDAKEGSRFVVELPTGPT